MTDAPQHPDQVSRPRPPGMRLARTRAEAHEGVEQEMLAEHAATLGRITAALEDAMAELRRLDERPHVSDRDREVGLDQVGRAAWHVLVQRESLGIGGDHLDWISRTHGVPDEALARLGTLRVLVDHPAATRGDRGDQGIPPVPWHALRSRPPGG